ncbi:protein APCDD1-like isoform X2 [Pseudomyrmex gracilis]|uniref:protein APCDD1-like isoform X2 n=1 Tax=Pseudomyrmex gracilis TaxID=219809 RepID=UPI0009949B1D|nr:protein APCDD1-like isoform X2 [Pseudomyrmex gracilis]
MTPQKKKKKKITLNRVGDIVRRLNTNSNQALSRDLETKNMLLRCKAAIEEVSNKDRATIVDDSLSRLYHTWLSQECEVRAGPEYIIRKYIFFENGSFLLLRYHYAEESCSIATHTVIIRGFINSLEPSIAVSGATDTKFHVDVIHIVPLNRQIAHKFGLKLNLTCGPQPKWRPYVPKLIYERSTSSLWQSPSYNSLQVYWPGKKRFDINCLQPFGIEFAELKLLRVQKRLSGPSGLFNFQLFLANPPPNVLSRWNYKPTSLQPTAMIRADTVSSCPICGSISRSNEFNPPLLQQTAALPALIGGFWHSERCESSEGGVWSRRQFLIYSGDKLWTGQWDHYDDPQCTKFLYTVTAAGIYVQRSRREKHHKVDEQAKFDYTKSFFKRSMSDNSATNKIIQNDSYEKNFYTINTPLKYTKKHIHARVKKVKRRNKKSLSKSFHQIWHDAQSFVLSSSVYSLRTRFTTMLRGHQTYETTTRKSSIWNNVPSSITELDLYIAESILIPGDIDVSTICNTDVSDVLLTSCLRSCVPQEIQALSTLRLRVKLNVNWNGQYILLLGLQSNNLWEAPLQQCAQMSPYNPVLQTKLRQSFGLRLGLLSSASISQISAGFFYLRSIVQIFLLYIYVLYYI